MAGFDDLFVKRFGFDVHRTQNGWYFYPITFDGFQQKDPTGNNNWFNFTGRIANSTPYGLFIGTGNDQFGLQIWRATAGPGAVSPPQNLDAEKTGTGAVLSWQPSPAAVRYHIFKADYAYWFQLGVPLYAGGTIYPRPFAEIGTTTDTNYSDGTPLGLWSHYYVVAEDAAGGLSDPSNISRAPSLNAATSFSYLQNTLGQWQTNGELSAAVGTQIGNALNLIKLLVIFQAYGPAQAQLQQLTQTVGSLPVAAWRAADLQVLLAKLNRRIDLARLGKIPALSVDY
jgi:hypothetical protein